MVLFGFLGFLGFGKGFLALGKDSWVWGRILRFGKGFLGLEPGFLGLGRYSISVSLFL